MRIVVVGGTGTIGSAVVEALGDAHEVIPVGHSSGRHRMDLGSEASIRELYGTVGTVDAVVCAAGDAEFGALDELTRDDFDVGIRSKLMGQVNLVRLGMDHVSDGGSFTLTSGVLAREPIAGSAAISPVNAAVEAFAGAAALELPREQRINAVSPPWVAETLVAMGRDPSQGLAAATVARAYVAAVEGDASGRVLDARDYA